MLAVIAIMALIISVIFPSIRQSIKANKAALCQSNLKFNHLSFYLYAADHDRNHVVSFEQGKYEFWPVLLERYRTGEVLNCPETTKQTRKANWVLGTSEKNYNIEGLTYSYGVNGWLHSRISPSIRVKRDQMMKTPDEIEDAETTPVFGDAVWIDGWPQKNNPQPTDYKRPAGGNGMRRFAVDRHGFRSDLKSNLVFYDGSVKSVQLLNLWKKTWHKDWK